MKKINLTVTQEIVYNVDLELSDDEYTKLSEATEKELMDGDILAEYMSLNTIQDFGDITDYYWDVKE